MFVILGYETFLQERMRKAREMLGENNGDPRYELKGSIDAEKKLRTWMENSPFEEIMQWFYCVREVTARTKAGGCSGAWP